MKKAITLFAAVLFMTGMVMAQSNTATTKQEGNDNTAQQSQVGQGNDAMIHQGDYKGEGGNMNVQNGGTAIQNQNGNDNVASIKQRSSIWGSGNTSEQHQSGDENKAYAIFFNSSNQSNQAQDGEGNWSKVKATGNGNKLETTQEGTANKAFSFMIGNEDMSKMSSTYQNGEGNEAYSKSKGYGNSIDIDQVGNYNKIGTKSWGDGLGVNIKGDMNDATVSQDGDENNAKYAVQGYNNSFTGTQTGNMNDMKVDQYNWYDVENYGNVINAEQSGEGNNLDVLFKGDENTDVNFIQDGEYNTIKGFGNVPTTNGTPSQTFTEDPFLYEGDRSSINIEQLGENNIVRGDIRGTNQDVDVNQESFSPGNVSEIQINASLGSDAASQSVDVDQVGQNYSGVLINGNGNDVTHNQYGRDNDGPLVGKNFAVTSITGSDNTSDVEQEGENSGSFNVDLSCLPFVSQFSLPAGVYHLISGSGNSASTEQDGNQNWAGVIQIGSNNKAKQLQDAWNVGGDEAIANHEADENVSGILQAGWSNEAEAYQFGDMNHSGIAQMGSGNTAIVDQGLWDQRYTPGLHGSNNGSYILQVGSGHNSSVFQNGSSNCSYILQTP